MKSSKCDQQFTEQTDISQLMDDLGDALKSNQPINMLGGGNPARIEAFNEVFLELYRALGNDSHDTALTSDAVTDEVTYDSENGIFNYRVDIDHSNTDHGNNKRLPECFQVAF